MNTFINANEAHELSIDELSAVSGGGGQCGNNNGPSWGQIANAASAGLSVAGATVTGGISGAVAEFAVSGVKSAVKQLAQ
jgi:bacteriocin-like protein